MNPHRLLFNLDPVDDICQDNAHRVEAPNHHHSSGSGENPMVGTTTRRARAIRGYGSTFDMGQVDGHPWPLEHAPRWKTDHHPWRQVTAPNGIRFASYEIQEASCVTCGFGGCERCV